MESWFILSAPLVGLILLLDFLLRKKKWRENTAGEKVSLLINLIAIAPYMVLSAYGILMGITGCGAETELGLIVYDVTLYMASAYVLVALGAVVVAFLLRLFGKVKASIWIHAAAIGYIVVLSVVNYLASTFL